MKKIISALLLSTAICAPVFAADTGLYGALDLQTWSLTNLAGAPNPSTGFRIGGGYHINQNFGFEANYAASGNGNIAGAGSYKVESLQAVAVGTYPINNMFDVYGKVGMASNKLTGSATTGCTTCSKSSLMYGVGGQYNINKQVGIRLEYANLGDVENPPTGPKTAASNVSLGVVYNF